jgi:hypothetical protein
MGYPYTMYGICRSIHTVCIGYGIEKQETGGWNQETGTKRQEVVAVRSKYFSCLTSIYSAPQAPSLSRSYTQTNSSTFSLCRVVSLFHGISGRSHKNFRQLR